jgi:class 3 adenylate cyclase
VEQHSYIHAAILFADIENSVMLSAALTPLDYDNLLNAYHAAMQGLVEELRGQGLPIGEYSIAGDQLSLFLYDPAEVERNEQLDGEEAEQDPARRRELIAASRSSNTELVFAALKAAVMLKNRWLLLDFNLRRVREHREPHGIGVGIHYGRVYLRERVDGRKRIEGFAVNLAKRVEGFARHGQYSHIMFSQHAHDKLRGTVRQHTQLRQRVFFHQHELELELLKGVAESQALFELKFLSRIGGVRVAPEVVEQYEAMFYLNPRNSWAYYQLFEHYAYGAQNWDKVLAMVKLAMLANPQDERLLLDLSRCYSRHGNLRQARLLAEQAIKLNPEFDLAYEHLATIAQDEGDVPGQVDYLSRAVGLAPGSPVNNMNLGLALCKAGDLHTAQQHLADALAGYPEYVDNAALQGVMQDYYSSGILPISIAQKFSLLEPAAVGAAAALESQPA